MAVITYAKDLTGYDDALNVLFAAVWPDHTRTDFTRLLQHSLTYVCAFDGHQLIGFVNLAWDGGVHAFLLDPAVHPDYRRRGIGLELVRQAVATAAERGIEWVHVDFEPGLQRFYDRAGFKPTSAGIMRVGE